MRKKKMLLAAALAAIVGFGSVVGASDANAKDKNWNNHNNGHNNSHQKVEKFNGHTYYRRGPYDTVFYRGNDRYIVTGSQYVVAQPRNYAYREQYRPHSQVVYYQPAPRPVRYAPSNGLSFFFNFD